MPMKKKVKNTFHDPVPFLGCSQLAAIDKVAKIINKTMVYSA
jgi:hypothetical protein